MTDKEVAMIPYFAHEGEMARAERTNRRLWLLTIFLIIALVGTNAGWIIYEGQFKTETVTETYEATADGNANAVLNGSGEVIINGGESNLHPDGAETGEGE